MKKKVARKPIKLKKTQKKSSKKSLRKIVRTSCRKPHKIAAKPIPARKVKPTAKKKPLIKKGPAAYEGTFVGRITHYFPQVSAAVVKLEVPLAVGDTIKVKGHTTDFTQKVASIQINRVTVQSAKVGDEIGIQVKSRVRKRDVVTKL